LEAGTLAAEGDLVRRPAFRAGSAGGGAGEALKGKVAAALARAGLTPPTITELPHLVAASPQDVSAVLKLLTAEGAAVRVSAELHFDAAALAGLRDRLVALLREKKAITTGEFKELVGATRKHVIPLAEHFDRERVTLRVGETRVLRGEQK
jgi:selenocysteine-specific elongation factor